jgi:hypothetical protein
MSRMLTVSLGCRNAGFRVCGVDCGAVSDEKFVVARLRIASLSA